MGGKKRAQPDHSGSREHYERLLATAGLTCKGKNMLYTSHNGHMFSFLAADGLASIRLPQAERDEFLGRFKTSLSVQYNTVMKEYALVPASLLPDTKTLAPYMKASLAYVRSLKPKPTKR